ncbi:hypothetical protein [Endozoicomonas sp. ONNA2]|uniref:hypothetical protein n=1 Tax=Endozoicomonas sp. ONNA2 TaxID=2828741 RepID=UPI0021498FC8|nr:hypothetical protein [Endozoicomonas sp. ONNA2]
MVKKSNLKNGNQKIYIEIDIMNPNGIIGASGFNATARSRSENTAPSLIGVIWRTITGPFRYVSSTTSEAELPDNQGYTATSKTDITDLKNRAVKEKSSSPLSLPNIDDHAQVFNEVVRRITIDQQSLIMEKANAITTDQLDHIVQCCHKPEQIITEHQSFLQSDDFAYAALRAYREKKISRNEFATLVTLQGVYLQGLQQRDSFEIHHNKLFDDNGEANEYVWQTIARSLYRSEGFFTSSFDPGATIEKMKLLLKNAPSIEAGFWHCKFADPIDKRQHSMRETLVNLDFLVLFAAFGCGWTICPSSTLRQAFLDSLCQEEAHQINPVIGISTPEDIRTGSLKGYRDMAIPFPGHPLPTTADDIPARLILEFMAHDLYHAVRASLLKNIDIQLIVAVADVVRKIKTSFHDEYIRVKQDFQQQKKSFENSISRYSQKQQQDMITKWQQHEDVASIKNTLQYLEHTKKALGQLAFNLDDLDTHDPTWRIYPDNYDIDRFTCHLLNILHQMNRSPSQPWRKLLTETDAGIVGQCIIPMISGNLSNPGEMYQDFCGRIHVHIAHAGNELSQSQKDEYAARSRKLIEPLNPSFKPDQSKWPTFLRETMLTATHIPD